MKTNKLYLLVAFVLTLSCCSTYAQSSLSKRKSIDSLSNITIEKLIYYQHPLVFKKGEIVDNLYLPIWYEADAAMNNTIVLKNKPEKAAKLFHSSSGITADKIAKLAKDTANENKAKRYHNKWPLQYYYGEVWITIKSTNQKIVLTLNVIKDKEFSNLKFKDPSEINTEEIENSGSYMSPTAYIYEDNILKVGDQWSIVSQFSNDQNTRIDFSIESFKGVLFRAKSYMKSTIKQGKRIFETIEKTPNGIVVKSISDKP